MDKVSKVMAWYANLSPSTLQDLPMFYAVNAKFKDPFNDVTGLASIEAIFVHMFKTTQHPRFIFFDKVQDGRHAFLTWHFLFQLNGKDYTVKGASHLIFNEEDFIIDHRDYWDAAEELWAKLPVLGVFIEWLRRKFSTKN